MAQLADLLDALERIGDQAGRPVFAHLDPALNDAAKAAVALGLTESVSVLTGTELRRLALRATLDAHYAQRPDDGPHVVEIALFLATARKLPVADRPDLPTILRRMADAMGPTSTPRLCWRPAWDTSRSLDPSPDPTPQTHRQNEPAYLVLDTKHSVRSPEGVRPGRYS